MTFSPYVLARSRDPRSRERMISARRSSRGVTVAAMENLADGGRFKKSPKTVWMVARETSAVDMGVKNVHQLLL